MFEMYTRNNRLKALLELKGGFLVEKTGVLTYNSFFRNINFLPQNSDDKDEEKGRNFHCKQQLCEGEF